MRKQTMKLLQSGGSKEAADSEALEPPGRGTRLPGSQQKKEEQSVGSFRSYPSSRKFSVVPGLKGQPWSWHFARRFFPEATRAEWNDWRWQLKHRIVTEGQLSRIVSLLPSEIEALRGAGGALPMAITPYYASLLADGDPTNPIRKCMVPTINERVRTLGEAEDPLCEEQDLKVPGLVHRYPDRVLFLCTDVCFVYCRYCTRSRMVAHGCFEDLTVRWQRGIDYIKATPQVRDVLISGGDPLTLPDEALEWLLARLVRIPHVEILRIGTKAPAVLPQRVTPVLCRMLRRYHPLWMSLHFTHPAELTPECAHACEMLADAGIPLGSQTVLLAGVNDSVETMKRLMHGLMRIRVKPYYLYQCDPIVGSSHFRTPVEKGVEIIRGLRGHTSGYAVPTYVIDAPGGGGKIPISPDYVLVRDASGLTLTNYKGGLYRYPDPHSLCMP